MYIDRQKETDRIHERCVQKERLRNMWIDRKNENDRIQERC